MRLGSIRVRSCGGAPARIVANLPYNVGTALLTDWLTDEAWPPWWQSLTLMFQREVAERIVADEGDRRITAGSAFCAAGGREARILFDVPPSAFVPPPKITSSVVHLTPRAAAPALPRRALSRRSPARPSGSAARCCGRA